MDDLLRNGDDKVVGPFSVLDELPQNVDLVYYIYTEDIVPAQDLNFDLSPDYELIILKGQRDSHGVALRSLKHCIRNGSPLTYHDREIYSVAVGYVRVRLNNELEHDILILVATMECDNVCDG